MSRLGSGFVAETSGRPLQGRLPSTPAPSLLCVRAQVPLSEAQRRQGV